MGLPIRAIQSPQIELISGSFAITQSVQLFFGLPDNEPNVRKSKSLHAHRPCMRIFRRLDQA